jgi:hypothetical protein
MAVSHFYDSQQAVQFVHRTTYATMMNDPSEDRPTLLQLQEELEAKNEELFDLSLSLKTYEAEGSKNQALIRQLNDQLRLAHGEANQARRQSQLKSTAQEPADVPMIISATPPIVHLPIAGIQQPSFLLNRRKRTRLSDRLALHQNPLLKSREGLQEEIIQQWRLKNNVSIDALELLWQSLQLEQVQVQPPSSFGSGIRTTTSMDPTRLEQAQRTVRRTSGPKTVLCLQCVETLIQMASQPLVRIDGALVSVRILLYATTATIPILMVPILAAWHALASRAIAFYNNDTPSRRLHDNEQMPEPCAATLITESSWDPRLFQWMAAALSVLSTTISASQQRSLLASVLDVLELVLMHIITATADAHHVHVSLTVQMFHWFHSLPRALLLTQMATTQSTSESWDRVASAVGVCQVLLHTTAVVGTEPCIRNELVAFFQTLFAANNTTSTFSLLMAEYMELYVSSLAQVVHDRKCDDDIRAMARMQMELLTDDNVADDETHL